MQKKLQKKKNPHAVALGRPGGKTRAGQPDFRDAQAKGRATFMSRFSTPEEKKAYFSSIRGANSGKKPSKNR